MPKLPSKETAGATDIAAATEAPSERRRSGVGDATVHQDPIITFRATVRSKAAPASVYDLLAAPATHLAWAGEQSPDRGFRLLTLEAPAQPAVVGTTFSSTGAGSKSGSMTFHDRSTVTEAARPRSFAFETEARLVRRRRPTWHARFVHHYATAAEDGGTRVDYTCAVHPQNYRPYWLHPFLRPMTRLMITRAMRRNMGNLARMAEGADRR